MKRDRYYFVRHDNRTLRSKCIRRPIAGFQKMSPILLNCQFILFPANQFSQILADMHRRIFAVNACIVISPNLKRFAGAYLAAFHLCPPLEMKKNSYTNI